MNNGVIDTDEEGSRRLSKLGEQRGGGVAQRGRLEGTGTEGAKRGRTLSFTQCVGMFCLFVQSDRSTHHSQAVRRRNAQVRSVGGRGGGLWAPTPDRLVSHQISLHLCFLKKRVVIILISGLI